MPRASEPPFLVVDLTPENIERLHNIRVARYESMLEAAKDPNSTRQFNVPEIFRLLHIWRDIKEKDFRYADFICCEMSQIEDAIKAGE